MAFLTVPNVRIDGLSVCVPKNVDSNLDGPSETLSERERLVKSTGICYKRTAERHVTCSDLGFEAAERLLDALAWNRDEVDAVIMVTQSGDYLIPSTAILLQDRLRLSKSSLAFDINLGCSGYPYGLSVIGSLLSSGQLRKAILVVGDKSSNPEADRSVASLFSDCCTVTAISHDPTAPNMDFDMNSDGSGFKAIYIRSGGSRHPFKAEDATPSKSEDGVMRKGSDVILSGVDILNFAIREIPPAVNRFMLRTDSSPDSYDAFVFHQANLLINETIRKRLKLDKDKTPMTLYEFGNTSSASIPITIQQRLRTQVSEGKVRLLLCGFGVGLSWVTASVVMDKVVCLPLIEI